MDPETEAETLPMAVAAILDSPGLKGNRVAALAKDGLTSFINSIISGDGDVTEPFFVLDLGVVAKLFSFWTRQLPFVQPFYAVKCNPSPTLLGALAALGANFDCSSRAEIDSVMSLGVSPDRIIFANPCKAHSHIKHAANVGVNLTTFDSLEELQKISKWHAKCDLLFRIKIDDSAARYPLGTKFGALPYEIEPLLQTAKALMLNVVGVCFHVGSLNTDTLAYRGAIAEAKKVFQTAVKLGLPRLRVMNIGGGFRAGPQFQKAASNIKSALQEHFSEDLREMKVMAEPGRFFAETAFTLVVNVIGKRIRGEVREYWINDGVFGSLACAWFDNVTFNCGPLPRHSNDSVLCAGPGDGKKMFESTVFGPTCDSVDVVLRAYPLPDLQVGDWLVFPNMGAYTSACASAGFGGFPSSAILTYLACSNLHW